LEDCHAEWFRIEYPQHEVWLDSFWIDKTEVTNEMYARCVADGACEPPMSTASYTVSAYYSNPAYYDYPVIQVTWAEARAYCERVGRRLPTEAEWEKAARGMDRRRYAWGNGDPNCDLANYGGCQEDTVRVGSYMAGASPYGVLDMAGNVREWVADRLDAGYYAVSPALRPAGPSYGVHRVDRGGAFSQIGAFMRSSFRGWNPPNNGCYDIGFRCALSQSP